MKKWFSKKSNLFLVVLFLFVIWRNAPHWVASFNQQGTLLPSQEYLVLNSDKKDDFRTFPPVKKNAIAIFWATWCGPCKIEMERLKTSVENGAIPAGAIYAINPFEDAATSRKFIKQNPYPFTFLEAPEVVKTLKVEVTPTTIYIEDNKITSMKTGLSIFGIWKAEAFL